MACIYRHRSRVAPHRIVCKNNLVRAALETLYRLHRSQSKYCLHASLLGGGSPQQSTVSRPAYLQQALYPMAPQRPEYGTGKRRLFHRSAQHQNSKPCAAAPQASAPVGLGYPSVMASHRCPNRRSLHGNLRKTSRTVPARCSSLHPIGSSADLRYSQPLTHLSRAAVAGCCCEPTALAPAAACPAAQQPSQRRCRRRQLRSVAAQ